MQFRPGGHNNHEWCLDWFGELPGGSVMDPSGPSAGEYRAIRGGCSFDESDKCRSASRRRDNPCKAMMSSLGFRVALVPVKCDLAI